MTDPIKSLSKVIETLRRQLSGPTETPKSASSPVLTPVAGPGSRMANGLQSRTRARIVALDPDDPGFYRKARRAFLQVVLSEEFGDEAASDPGFFRLLEALEQTIDTDESLSKAFEELTRRLRDIKN